MDVLVNYSDQVLEQARNFCGGNIRKNVKTTVERCATLYLILFGILFFAADATAQWRIATPRDTIYVPANTPIATQSNIAITSGTQMFMRISGTYGIITGQNGAGFDARYTYSVPNWNAPFPLPNPPDWNGTSFETYLAITTNNIKEDSIKVLEKSYQPNHIYTALYTSAGPKMKFRIIDRLKEKPDGSYYKFASGGLKIELARWTAGVAIKNTTVDFQTVTINTTSTYLDSIASYGIDALQVDSIIVNNTSGASDFSVVSERPTPFTLPSETTNELRIKFAPTKRGDIYGTIYIYSHNADGSSKLKVISLHGIGASPTLSVGPKTLDFGRVRVNNAPYLYANVYNGGNGTLNISNSQLITSTGGFAVSPSGAFQVQPGSNAPIKVTFRPTALQKYSAVLRLQGAGVPTDSVIITGEGATPRMVAKDSILDFGTVKNKDAVNKTTWIKNTGNYTANVVMTEIFGPNKSAFTLNSTDYKYLIDADSTHYYPITYTPGAGFEGTQQAFLRVSYDDGTSTVVILRGYEVEPHLILGRHIVDFGKVRVNFTKEDTLSLWNNSNLTLTLDPPRILPATSPVIFQSNALPNIGGNVRDSLKISFTPDKRGPFSAWMHLRANGQADSVYLLGFGAVPKAVFKPDSLDYGIVATGQPSVLFTTLTDSGDYPLKIVDYKITGDDANDFKILFQSAGGATPDPKYTVEPGANINIAVRFTTQAKTGQMHYATLHIIYEDGTSDSVKLIAREQAQYVELGRRTINFGKVRVNTHNVDSALFSNGSNATLTVATIWASGNGFTTTSSSLTVQPQQVGKVPVDFYPTARGNYNGSLYATGGNFKMDSVILTGSAGAPIPSFSAKAIDFGTVILPAQNSSSRTLDLTNAGDWPLTASKIEIVDPKGEFTIDAINDYLQEGQKRTYNLTFTVKEPQLLHTADLVFHFDDSSQEIIKLEGRDESPYIIIDSNSLSFGKVRVGTTDVRTVHLINTSNGQMSAANTVLTGDPTFTASKSGAISVAPKSAEGITVTFKPTAMGKVTAELVASGGQINGEDTVFISGIGAQPNPVLSTQLLDFGSQLLGTQVKRIFTLTNKGNWPLHVTSVTIIGLHQIDYTHAIPPDFILEEDSSITFSVDFLAQTPFQTTPRSANLIFTTDDGGTIALPLIAIDRAPKGTQLVFGSYLARPNDPIFADLKLKTAIADSLQIREFSGTLIYDTTYVTLLSVEKGTAVASDDWQLSVIDSAKTGFQYQLISTSSILTNPGALLHLSFKAKGGAQAGSMVTLRHTTFSYPGTREIVADVSDGIIIIDSSCGSTHITAGTGMANYIDQNTPNPANGVTLIPLDIGANGTSVTLRVLDVTGKTVVELANDQLFDQGSYKVPVDTRSLKEGVYFYEFSAGGSKPVVKKMIVTKQ